MEIEKEMFDRIMSSVDSFDWKLQKMLEKNTQILKVIDNLLEDCSAARHHAMKQGHSMYEAKFNNIILDLSAIRTVLGGKL